MRVDPAEFRRLELRCHALLADVSLHDVWAIALDGGGANRTISDVRALLSSSSASPANPAVRGLFAIRRRLGRMAGWDRERRDWSAESYLGRLTDDDRAGSLVAPGTREGGFRMLYLFPNEALAEIRNATVHAFSAHALVPRAGGYMLYWAIYVKPVGRRTPLYMAIIDPFRRFVVYPGVIRQLQTAWSDAYG